MLFFYIETISYMLSYPVLTSHPMVWSTASRFA